MGSTPAKPQRKLVKKPPAKKATRKVKASPPQSPDSRDNNATAKRPTPIVRPSPDAQDVAGRSSQQKAQDRKAVAKATTSGKYVKAQPNLPTVKQFSQQNKASVAGKVAPVLTVLNQTTRPLHAIAGAAKADVHTIKTQGLGHYLAHGSPEAPHAALRGVENKDTTTFSDVFTETGWKPKGTLGKVAKGAASFGADVVADPTSYVSGGTGSIAEKAGEDAAARVSKKALATGLTQDQAARAGERARNVAQKSAASKGSGATVGLAGREVPVVRRATASAGRLGGRTLHKTVPDNVRNASRAMGADVNPNIAPVGVSKAEYATVRKVTRTARGATNTGNRAATDIGHGVRRKIGEANYAQVVDAIERGQIKKLPDELHAPALAIRDAMRHANRLRKQAGIRGGEIKDRPLVKVPAVTADVQASAKGVAQARRSEASAQRALEHAQSQADVHQGRAEVLSRNVSGSRAEKAAERGRKRKIRVKTPTIARYAGGGHGVTQTRTAVNDAEQHLKNATAAREAAEAAHESTKTLRKTQRAASDSAVKTNAKRSVAPKSYIPHPLTDEGLEEAGHTVPESPHAGFGGSRSVKPTSSRARAVGRNKPLSVLHQEFPGQYRTDLHGVIGERVAQGHAAVAAANRNRALAALGRTVGKGDSISKGDDVWHVKGSNIRAVTSHDEKQAIVDTGHGIGKEGNGGRFVVLPKAVVEDAIKGSSPNLEGPGIVHAFDKATSGFKRIALATPAFHIRNAIGDTSQALVKQPAGKLAVNLVRGRRVTKALGRESSAVRDLAKPKLSGKTLHLPKYGHTSYEDIADNLVKAGAARSGYTAGELRELSQSGGSKASKLLAPKRAAGETKLGQGAKRLFLNREDIPRLATAIHTLRKGGTYEDAAKAVADTHFDYQDLTPFERNIARRIIPFYTWSARNIPFQAKNVIAHPGKYAGYEKILEEAQKSSDPGQATDQQQRLYKALQLAGVKLPKDYHRFLSDYQQRNAGIPLSWKGHKFTVSAGLPLQDLNEFPGAAGKGQIGEYFQKLVSLTNPIIKDPGELWANYSTFFRDQIQSDDSPLVGAPSFVGSFPKDIQAKLGIVKGLDKRSGKIVYKWPAKTDYVAHALPGAGSQVMRLLTPGANRNGGGPGQAAVKLAGVTSQRIDPTSQAIDLAYARVAEINKRLAGLRQQINPANKYPISSQNPTKEYVDLSAQLQLANEIAYYGKAMRGDKVLPTAGKPKSG